MDNSHPKDFTDVLDTCSEGAYRINVVMKLVHEHQCGEPDCDFDLNIVQDVLTDVRDTSRRVLDVEHGAKPAPAGGAR